MLLFYLFGGLIIYRHICIMVVDDILQHFLPPRPGSRLLWKPLHPSPLVWDSQPIACPDFWHLALHHHGAQRVCHGFRWSELARENPSFIDDSLIETSMYIGFLIAMFDYQRVYNMHIFIYLVPYTDEWNFACWWEKLREMELLSSPQANPPPKEQNGWWMMARDWALAGDMDTSEYCLSWGPWWEIWGCLAIKIFKACWFLSKWVFKNT